MTMPEHVCDGEDLHTDLTHLHEALTVTRSEALADPRNQVEGLDQAACGPHLKHLAELAAAAAAGWRLRPRLARRRPRSGRTVGSRAVGQRGDLHAPSRPLAMETLTAMPTHGGGPAAA